ncbi:MAG TPA: SMP-30/gluconolactonase/LRE family protein [Urbifossiella sp.]|nr:SMP-30/gluconolactonase/LRE family protein [Urbifossiella sp.]
MTARVRARCLAALGFLVPAVMLPAAAPRAAAQDGAIPKGTLLKQTFAASKVFPGTTRGFTVYVPQQYDGKTPACVYVNQDGVQWNAPAVFDKLIAEKAMPVTIGVFVSPGVVPAAEKGALSRFNRSFEYDGLGDAYARFVLDELLPAVEQLSTPDGRKLLLSKNGNDRGIGGSSSGAVCAFTAAWERPDGFTRVFSGVGTYVGLRGANIYPTLIRKFEPRPLRVFLQDGENDLNIYAGDWWMANQEMERSLKFAGYEVEHAWDKGGHSGEGGTKVFPEAMRFLWKGWPEPVKAGKGSPQLQQILIPGEGWQLVGEGYAFTEGPSANAKGEVFFNDVGKSKTYRVGEDGKPAVWIEDSKRGDGQRHGPDGRLYANAGAEQKVLAWDADGKAAAVADGFKGNDLVVRHDGGIFVTDPFTTPGKSSVWYVSPKGEKKVVDTGLAFANGITLSPDQALLYVADSRSHWVYSYQVKADGALAHKQRYYHLYVPDTAEDSGADGLRTDRDGRLWVATRSGLQVCDQAGRVNAIIPTPNGKVSNLTFGGPNFDVVYATCGDKVYRRKVKVQGANHFAAPITPKGPQL